MKEKISSDIHFSIVLKMKNKISTLLILIRRYSNLRLISDPSAASSMLLPMSPKCQILILNSKIVLLNGEILLV